MMGVIITSLALCRSMTSKDTSCSRWHCGVS